MRVTKQASRKCRAVLTAKTLNSGKHIDLLLNEKNILKSSSFAHNEAGVKEKNVHDCITKAGVII